MNYIYINSISNHNDDIFSENVRDDSNRTFIILKEKFRKLGYILTTVDNKDIKNAKFIFFFDYPSVFRYKGFKGFLRYIYDFFIKRKTQRNVYKECIKLGYQNKMILFLWEGKAVCPENWKPSFHKLFNKIFTWNDDYIDNVKYFKFNWPQNNFSNNLQLTPFNNRKLLVNISMNKKSKYKYELYSKRLNAIKYFEHKSIDNFDLFGFGWNKPSSLLEYIFPFLIFKHKSYKGIIQNKFEILTKYKFSICYENISEENGWITEKIFDCLKSGTIPIYWGAKNIEKYIDPTLFINKEKYTNYEDLYNKLINFTEEEYCKFLEDRTIFLNSERFNIFTNEKFCNVLINNLQLSLNV